MKLFYKRTKIKIRKKLNPYLGPFRRYFGGVNKPFTIISNNCWGGLVYQYYSISYNTPTVGLYFFADDYIRFVKNLRYYLDIELSFISYEQSKHKEILLQKKQTQVPIGILGDVEIIFLHYKTNKEAKEKWERRKKRICWDNLFVKFSEMNQCTIEHLKQFDKITYDNKLLLVSQDYGLKSQVIVKSHIRQNEVYDDTSNFQEGIILNNWLTKKPYKK